MAEEGGEVCYLDIAFEAVEVRYAGMWLWNRGYSVISALGRSFCFLLKAAEIFGFAWSASQLLCQHHAMHVDVNEGW